MKTAAIDMMIETENEDDYLSGKIWSLTRKVNSKKNHTLLLNEDLTLPRLLR